MVWANLDEMERLLAEGEPASAYVYPEILPTYGPMPKGSDGIFVLLRGVFTYVNESFAAAVGRKCRDLVGDFRLTDLAPEEDRLMLTEGLSRLAAAGGARCERWRVRPRDRLCL